MKSERVTIIDEGRGVGVDIIRFPNGIIHKEILEPSDWGRLK